MLFDGIKLVEGSEINNLVVQTGTAWPTLPSEGELFYMKEGGAGIEGLYVYDGTQWLMTNNDIALGDITAALGYTPANKAGDTFTGPVILSGAPSQALEAATKSYVDSAVGAVGSGAQPLDGDLTAISGLSGTGILRRTGVDSWSLDTSNYLTSNQTVTISGDASGSGSTTINLALANTGVSAGSYGSASSVATLSVDPKGRILTAVNTPISIDASQVTAGTFASSRISQASVTQHQAALSILESQITDGTLIARVGSNETITGAWEFNSPIIVGTPVSNNHAATKSYVDGVAQGIQTKPSVEIATTANLSATYSNGTAGVGATLTATSNGAFPQIDGVTLTSTVSGSNGVLVKNQTNPAHNGRYNLTTVGDGSTPWVLTRCGLCDEASEIPGAFVFVKQGTSNAGTGWVQTVANPSTFVMGTDAITVTQFSGAGTYVAGSGLTLSGNTFNVGTASASRIVVNADNIDLATTGVVASTYRSVTVDAYGRVIDGSNPTTVAGYGITDAITTANIGSQIVANVSGTVSISNGGTGATSAEAAIDALGGAAINPVTPKDGDIRITAGPTISIYATGAWRQVFPAVYS